MKELLRQLGARTEPRPGVEDRLRAGLNPPPAGPLLRALGDAPTPGGDAALVARLRARVRPPRPGPSPRALVVGGALLLAGAVAVVEGAGGAPDEAKAPTEGAANGPERGEEGPGAVAAAPPPTERGGEVLAEGTASMAALPAAPGANPLPPTTALPTSSTRSAVGPRPSTPAAPGPRTAPAASPLAPTAAPSGSALAGSARAGAPPASPLPASALEPATPLAATDDARSGAALPLPTPRLSPATPFQREGRKAVLRWEVGTLDAGLDATDDSTLLLRTREGEVELSRGEVELRRDRLGTRLLVRAGGATLRCEGAAPRPLGAGDAAECLPTRALGWLGRAEALRDAGAPLADVLAALRAGQAVADDAALAELVALEVEVLREAGRVAEARAAAARYPEDGPRAAELRR